MGNEIQISASYKNWIKEVSARFHKSQIKAASHVNEEMLEFYWSLGRDIHDRSKENHYGSSFYRQVSTDLRRELPDVKSFSVTNLRYMVWFYELYPDAVNLPQIGDESENENLPQVGVDSACPFFLIPWGHNKLIIDRCKNDRQKALFFVRKTLDNNWSRAVLLNFLDTDLYERQGKAISNFRQSLPEPGSDLAQQMTKDPYNFDFLTLREDYDEKELKDALMDNIREFLLELGTGFAFVGREYRLVVGQTEQFLDMLFYNFKAHCFVVVEAKVRAFDPRDMGQLGTYVSAVDGILRGEGDNQTIGLLICKTKDNVLAQYSVNSIKEPVAISEYELSKLMPDEYKSSMPTLEEIEKGLEGSDDYKTE